MDRAYGSHALSSELFNAKRLILACRRLAWGYKYRTPKGFIVNVRKADVIEFPVAYLLGGALTRRRISKARQETDSSCDFGNHILDKAVCSDRQHCKKSGRGGIVLSSAGLCSLPGGLACLHRSLGRSAPIEQKQIARILI